MKNDLSSEFHLNNNEIFDELAYQIKKVFE